MLAVQRVQAHCSQAWGVQLRGGHRDRLLEMAWEIRWGKQISLLLLLDEQKYPVLGAAGGSGWACMTGPPPRGQGFVSKHGVCLCQHIYKPSVILFSAGITCAHLRMSHCFGKHPVFTTYSSSHWGKPQGQGYAELFCSLATTPQGMLKDHYLGKPSPKEIQIHSSLWHPNVLMLYQTT